MSFLSSTSGRDHDGDEDSLSNARIIRNDKIGSTIGPAPMSEEAMTPLPETRTTSNASRLPLVTNSGPGQRQRSSLSSSPAAWAPLTRGRARGSENDDGSSSSSTETEESDDDDDDGISASLFPTFDYGECQSQPDALMSTLETQVNNDWASPTRRKTEESGVTASFVAATSVSTTATTTTTTTKVQEIAAAPACCLKVEGNNIDFQQAYAESNHSLDHEQSIGSLPCRQFPSRDMAVSVPLSSSSSALCGGLRKGRVETVIRKQTLRLVFLPHWLVDFLSHFRRRANRRRIPDVSCSQPQCKYFLHRGSSILTSLLDSIVQDTVWAEMFRRWLLYCRLSRSEDRLEFLEQTLRERCPPKRGTRSMLHERSVRHSKTNIMGPTTTNNSEDYRYSLLNIIRGKDGWCMTSRFRLGRRMDRIETRRRELLAIVPHTSSNHGDNDMLEQDDPDDHDNKIASRKLWETALIVGYCAWTYYSCQSNNSQQTSHMSCSSGEREKAAACADPPDDSKEDPREALEDDDKENNERLVQIQQQQQQQQQHMKVLDEEPVHEVHVLGAEDHDCGNAQPLSHQWNTRTKKRKDTNLDFEEVPSSSNKHWKAATTTTTTTSNPVNDLSKVLLEEKSRRIKARAKELSMLQRFGLCSGHDPSEDWTMEELEMEDVENETSIGTKKSTAEAKHEQLRPSASSELTGPPLRCGSPSSLNRKLKRKRTPSTVLKERQQPVKKKPKHDTSPPVRQDYQENHVLRVDTQRVEKMTNLPNTGQQEDGAASAIHPDSEGAVVPAPLLSSPTSPLRPSTLVYDGASLTHSAHGDVSSPLSVDRMEGRKEVKADQKPDPLASRSTPLTYDDDVELSERAKSMLQALENTRFQHGNTDHSNRDRDGQEGPTEPLALKLSKRERKQQRKEAKDKRKDAKKKRKKAKHSKKKKKADTSGTNCLKSHPPTAAGLLRSDADQNDTPVGDTATAVATKEHKFRPASTKPARKHSQMDSGSSQVRLPSRTTTTGHGNKSTYHDQNTTSPTDVCQQYQCRPVSPKPVAKIAPPALATPPRGSIMQADTVADEGKTLQARDIAPTRLLCSESFVEEWGEVVVKLATGSWDGTRGGTRICFLDSSLIDYVGVDIEDEAEGAVIVSLLSATMRSGFSCLLKRVVDIASLSRYATLEVIICADIDIEPSANGIARLQNAVMRRKGLPSTLVSVQLVSPSSLASCLADIFIATAAASEAFSFIEDQIASKKTWERIRFLLSIVPSLSVRKAFQIVQSLSDGDQDDSWLRRLFDSSSTMQNDSIARKVREQLAFALSTPLMVGR